MLIPPLRAPLEHDIKASMSLWLDEANNNCGFLSSQVQDDLKRIASLRNSLVEAGDDHEKAVDVLHDYKVYHAALLRCEAREFPSSETSSSARHLQFPWKSSNGDTEVHSHLAWERANVLWNVAALLAYQASIQEKRDRTGWNQAHLLLQDSASTIVHMMVLEEQSPDFNFTSFWKSFLLAQAQIATYYMALASPKPRHVVLAKIASAAVSLSGQAARNAQSNEIYQIHSKAWKTWMLALAQYHESCVHRQKKAWDLEFARLDRARDAITVCQESVYSIETQGLEMLQGEVPKMIRTIRSRLLELQNDYDGQPASNVREIRGEVLVKHTLPLSRDLTSLKRPLFQNVQKLELNSASRQAILKFQQELDTMVREMSRMSSETMEDARVKLVNANLPHSLTAYNQEQSGGGIPIDLWERIESIQDQELLPQLKRDLWELREMAEMAVSIHSAASKQLAEDLEMDRQFRELNPRFEGHDAADVQWSFRLSLENYESLLTKSRKGDEILIRRLGCLGSDPKYKLLQVQKSQLDKILPAEVEGGSPIDTSKLARLLVLLSTLFDEREELLHKLKMEASKDDFAEAVAKIDPASPTARQDYERLAQMSLKLFVGISSDIRGNVSRQGDLLDSILTENEHFVAARDAMPSNDNENCFFMIEEAIEEIEQLRKHLREGKEFYIFVIPKLEHLKHEVGDTSARLTAERCEYEDSAQSRHQEIDDARLAASLADEARSHNATVAEGGNRDHSLLSEDPTAIAVDDSKVANLVAMDFAPEKVVEALKKHKNDMDRALNELLC